MPEKILPFLVALTLLGVLVMTMLFYTLGKSVYVADATPTPVATPMDVTLKMRGPDGEIQEIWVCKYSRKDGWVCELEEEANGNSVDR